MIDQQISFSMEKTFREAFQAFAQETLNLFGQNPALAETPIAVCWIFFGNYRRDFFKFFFLDKTARISRLW